jgi:hypothetical protein
LIGELVCSVGPGEGAAEQHASSGVPYVPFAPGEAGTLSAPARFPADEKSATSRKSEVVAAPQLLRVHADVRLEDRFLVVGAVGIATGTQVRACLVEVGEAARSDGLDLGRRRRVLGDIGFGCGPLVLLLLLSTSRLSGRRSGRCRVLRCTGFQRVCGVASIASHARGPREGDQSVDVGEGLQVPNWQVQPALFLGGAAVIKDLRERLPDRQLIIGHGQEEAFGAAAHEPHQPSLSRLTVQRALQGGWRSQTDHEALVDKRAGERLHMLRDVALDRR